MNAQRQLDELEREQRRADARFRGEEPEDDQGGELSVGELLLGGALVGLALLAVIALIAAVVAAFGGEKRRDA